MKIIAVLGISGVGKSTLVEKVANRKGLLHLKASDLIKARLTQTSEQLRQGAVLDNQALMIAEFADRIAAADEDIIVFDGHSLIDTPKGLLEIPFYVFEVIRPSAFIFVEDTSDLIAQRRVGDAGRVRPMRSSAELAHHQALAKGRTASFAQSLGVPLYVLAPSDVEGFLMIL